MKMPALIFVVLVLSQAAMAQDPTPMENLHIIPHLAFGGEWMSEVTVHSLSSGEGKATVEIFAEDGSPLPVPSDHGTATSFEIFFKGFGSETLVFPREGSLTVGWARVRSALKLGMSVGMKQFVKEAQVGSAVVPASPSRLAFSLELSPTVGLALVNANRDKADVALTVFDRSGKEVQELAREFQLEPGCHMSGFFRDPPFSTGELKGLAVISSNLPLSALALMFDGSGFSAIPVLSAPRRLDMPQMKIGLIYFVPSDRTAKPYAAARIEGMFRVLQQFLDREMPLNGLDSPDLMSRIDRDPEGQPKVTVVKGKKPWRSYVVYDSQGFARADYSLFHQEVYGYEQTWPFKIIIPETFDIIDGKLVGRGYSGGCDVNSLRGRVQITSDCLALAREDWFGNDASFAFIQLPEFSWPFGQTYYTAKTWQELADFHFHMFGHEFSHSLGLYFHLESYRRAVNAASSDRYIMGAPLASGFFRRNGTTEGVLLPVEAKILSTSPLLTADSYGWPKAGADTSVPEVRVKVQELSPEQLHLIFSAADPESGVSSVLVCWNGLDVLSWKEVTHTDQGDLEIRVPVSSATTRHLVLRVFNAKGGRAEVCLTDCL